jgi:hypothetical protein
LGNLSATITFEIRAEREGYERLFSHEARVLLDRLVDRSRTDRSRPHAIPE